jgi:hypothetical protein
MLSCARAADRVRRRPAEDLTGKIGRIELREREQEQRA